ncbi:hypothetical protein [Bradyrhizobium sp. ARR65]|uniref:hypothetical protein n=1 Tax=Bradyrhizobium sp. ARR65 TaxID=1040989 RepID=UPI000A6D73B1|nr:hypothetical protein [Bradyrhizobium sp. ARR65]
MDIFRFPGLKMQKIGDCSDDLFDRGLRHSLSTIKEAHVRLHGMTSLATTATLLASQIALCDVLLIEISGIRSSLAKHTLEVRNKSPATWLER